MMRLQAPGRECREQMLRHPAHVRARGPRDDDEIVGRLAQAASIQYYWVDGLAVHERADNLGELSLHSARLVFILIEHTPRADPGVRGHTGVMGVTRHCRGYSFTTVTRTSGRTSG